MVVVARQLFATTVVVIVTKWVESIVMVTVFVDEYVATVSVESGDVGPRANITSVTCVGRALSVWASETVTTGVDLVA